MTVGLSRYALAMASVTAIALGLVVACVESDSGSSSEDGGPLSDALVLPDGTASDADAASEDAVGPDAGPCSEGGFCPVPVPDRMSLVGISGSSMDDAWAIARDTILRWNGTSWKKVYKYDGPSPDFYGIWVSKRDDVWVLGTGLLVRYSARDGGAPAFRVHAESVRGAAYEVTSFWVNPASDQLWMATDGAGHGSFGYRYREEADGTLREDHITEAPISFPWVGEDETFFVRSIFGFDSEDIYVGGEWCNTGSCSWSQETDRYGAIAHYDGRNWSIAKTLAKGQRVSKIYGTTATDQSRRLWIWAGMAGYPDNSIRLLPATREGAVGDALYSRTIRTDPAPFSPLISWTSGCTRVFGSVVSATEAWFSDVCFVYRWSDTALEVVSTPIHGLPLGNVTGVWAANADEAWLVGELPRPGDPSAPPMGFAVKRTRSSP